MCILRACPSYIPFKESEYINDNATSHGQGGVCFFLYTTNPLHPYVFLLYIWMTKNVAAEVQWRRLTRAVYNKTLCQSAIFVFYFFLFFSSQQTALCYIFKGTVWTMYTYIQCIQFAHFIICNHMLMNMKKQFLHIWRLSLMKCRQFEVRNCRSNFDLNLMSGIASVDNFCWFEFVVFRLVAFLHYAICQLKFSLHTFTCHAHA